MSSQVALEDGTVEQLRSAVGGQVITPADADYEEARLVWNGMIDCRPAVIVRCASTDDVVAAVNFGREHDLVVSVRGGSHSTPGYSTCDDGIVIDLGPMNRVDGRSRRPHRAGAGWRDLGPTWTPRRRSTGSPSPAAASPTPASGASRLGSGSGWLERMYGVTCESLLSAEVVTADGKRRQGQRRREPGAVLGPARRRRQLRRGDRVRVPPPSGGPDRDGRDAGVPARARRRRSCASTATSSSRHRTRSAEARR